MSERAVHSIAGRLSLRPPQRESLGLLHDIVEALNPHKGQGVEDALAVFKQAFPKLVEKGFEEFEREFPSFCFGLATGVGKTRLMGAFITYLVTARNIRHFMVLAPNLTIYNKLIDDFQNRTSPKYVFQGIAEFAQDAPFVVTGDSYESVSRSQADMFGEMGVTINIFNISKINSEVRGGNEPRVRKTREILGESYYDYLAALPDLVLLMDESHRYRASAGVKAINELKPILGLELTATPKVKSGGGFVDFKNVVYSYPLNKAIEDGFVKEPAVATRENFRAVDYTGEDGKIRLEKLKLEDGIRVHENVKIDLQAYAGQTGSRIVKPFVLVVAQDTAHADELQKVIEDETFFEGRYAGKVITVHSNQKGEEKDENVKRLLAVEDPNEPTEIVIHVNKLQEGWDVTNLYTIVPLRASASDILTEQTIGRGLRLPYGRRTGEKSIDRLTIIAHEHFQRIIDDANRPDSIIRSGVVIGRDIPIERKQVVETKPKVYLQIEEQVDLLIVAEDEEPYVREVKADALRKTMEVIQRMERLPSGTDLGKPEVIKQVAKDVKEMIRTRATGDLIESAKADVDIEPEVKRAIDLYVNGSISVPKIVIQPKDTAETFFTDFDMETRGINLQPVAHDILVKHLQSQQSDRIRGGTAIVEEERLEDYLVRHLIKRNDMSYDDHAELLYKLAGQVVERVQSYLRTPDDVLNVIQYHSVQLAELIYAEMVRHKMARVIEYEAVVTRGFITLKPATYTHYSDNGVRDFRETLDTKRDIRSLVYTGFSKCLYPIQKFDSDSERRFAVLLEDDDDVLRWFKPARDQFHIFYNKDRRYEPDFVIEMKDCKVMAEPKSTFMTDDKTVEQKAEAAREWCRHASEHAVKHGDKPWRYILAPHEDIEHGRRVASFFAD